jgi:hypothetical protein
MLSSSSLLYFNLTASSSLLGQGSRTGTTIAGPSASRERKGTRSIH